MARPSAALCGALIALIALAAPTLATRSAAHVFNPQYCPNTISRQAINPRLASDCKGVIITRNLCTKCRLRPYDNKGNFVNNRDIYNLEAPECLAGMQDYVSKNPCDTPRVKQVNDYTQILKDKKTDTNWGKQTRKDLAEFMYNVCELCCDCVPIGSEIDEYKNRSTVKKWVGTPGSLIFVYRGNCPVHYYYDTCRMWPDLRDIAPPGKKPNTNLDRICQDHVYPWWFNPKLYRKNWLANPRATIPSWRFVNFLVKMTRLLGCNDETFWKDCVGMELAQGRV